MEFCGADLYTTIEDATGQSSQHFSMTGSGKGSSNLKGVLKAGFVKDKDRFEDSWRKSYLLLDTKRRSKKSKREKPPKGLTHKERKLLKVFDIPKELQKFALVEPLHELWCGYMEETFRLSNIQPNNQSSVQEDLTKADFHGSLMKIVNSTNSTLIGLEGIVVRETKNTFHLITREDQLKVVPKAVCTFMCSIRKVQIKIFGVNFCARPADRIKKKLGKRRPIEVL